MAVQVLVEEVKPRLRGWLHLCAVPVTLVAGVVLVALSPTATTRAGSAAFIGSALLLFTVSALYHRGRWSPHMWGLLRRLDHANIFALIAGSYTAFALVFLHGRSRWLLLGLVWGVAAVGVVFRVLWIGAPRWLYVPLYVALGWTAAAFFGPVTASARSYVGLGISALALVFVGGVLYTLGGLVYGLKKPNPSPTWFGFHEVFHSLTLAAFFAQYVGLSLATYTLVVPSPS